MNTIRNASAAGWRALLSDSVVGRLFHSASIGPRGGDPIADPSADEAVLRLSRSSAVVRAMAKPGEAIAGAWPHSRAAAALAAWLGIPLDARIRATATMVAVAALTHLAQTRFRAPQPTATARGVWIAMLILLTTAAVAARPIAAAWIDWRERRTKAREDETA
jgi:hypothetical protein